MTFGVQKSLSGSKSHFWGPKVTFGVQKPFRRKITNGEQHAPADRGGTGDPPRARLRGAGGRPARAPFARGGVEAGGGPGPLARGGEEAGSAETVPVRGYSPPHSNIRIGRRRM